MTILKVCAWCGLKLNDGEPGPNGEVSHGICEKCREQEEDTLGRMIRRALRNVGDNESGLS